MRQEFEVAVGGDDHSCCGDAIEPNALVRLRARVHGDPPRLVETRHPVARDGEWMVVSGRVVDLEALVGTERMRVPVTRVPSGRALRGFDPVDDGTVLAVSDEEPLPGSVTDFVVTVDGDCRPDPPPDPDARARPAGRW